jgi:hypothetical protein
MMDSGFKYNDFPVLLNKSPKKASAGQVWKLNSISQDPGTFHP